MAKKINHKKMSRDSLLDEGEIVEDLLALLKSKGRAYSDFRHDLKGYLKYAGKHEQNSFSLRLAANRSLYLLGLNLIAKKGTVPISYERLHTTYPTIN